MHLGLQIIRADPVTAHGYAPGEILLGRRLVYPCEIKKKEIDFEGTNMTSHLVEKLDQIHRDNFGQACEKIKLYQDQYKKKYDKRHKVKEFQMKVGDKVQIKRIRTKKAKGGKNEILWQPRNSFYTLCKINKRRKTVLVSNSQTSRNLTTSYSFDRVRAFKG
jgi:transcription termination factor Rho